MSLPASWSLRVQERPGKQGFILTEQDQMFLQEDRIQAAWEVKIFQAGLKL